MEAPGRGPKSGKRGLKGAYGFYGSPPSSWGLRPVARSFAFAWAGLSYVYLTEPNMRLHVLFATLAGAACIVLGVGRTEVLMVVLAIAGVLLAEVVNTVAESMTDLLEPHHSPIAKVVKDVAAAGVLLSAAFSVLIAVIVFYPVIPELGLRLRTFLDVRWRLFALYLAMVVLPALAGLALPLSPGTGPK
ncbi:MAG: diacylglycerol kinase family protein [Bacillota bacterium]